MCGIVGLFCKSPELEPRLGGYLAAMLEQMSDRGPDSAGRRLPRPGAERLEQAHALLVRSEMSWDALCAELAATFGGAYVAGVRANHAVLVVEGEAAEVEDLDPAAAPRPAGDERGAGDRDLQGGRPPEAFVEQFRLGDIEGSHGLGHTRMATESRVTTEGSHPFSTGLDCAWTTTARSPTTTGCGSCFRREGIDFQTENDTEVAAGYLAWRMREGASLQEALEGALADLDGFYNLPGRDRRRLRGVARPDRVQARGARRDGRWVAMSSENRAIAVFPGASDARLWEPEPSVVYAWEKALV